MRDFKKMRILFVRVISFGLLLVMLLLLASFLLDPVRLGLQDDISERERYFLNLMAEERDMVDVVVMGDSESYTLMSTHKLWQDSGIAAYIGGKSGEWIGESYMSLLDILKKQSPKLVVLETNELFSDRKTERDMGAFIKEYALHAFPVLRYHRFWKNENKSPLPMQFNGFEYRNAVAAYTGGEYMHETTEKEDINIVRMYFLNKIRIKCAKEGIALLLVSAPSPLNHTMKRHNCISDYARKYDIPYIDMNMMTEELGIDWNLDTLDQGDHLNYSGCMKTTAYLEQYMKEHYRLPDRRSEKRYEEWNKKAEQFQALIPKN